MIEIDWLIEVELPFVEVGATGAANTAAGAAAAGTINFSLVFYFILFIFAVKTVVYQKGKAFHEKIFLFQKLLVGLWNFYFIFWLEYVFLKILNFSKIPDSWEVITYFL